MGRVKLRPVVAACLGGLVFLVGSCTASNDRHDHDDGPLATCLAQAGYRDPLVNMDHRRQQDAAFNRAFEACAAAADVEVRPPGEVTRLADEALRRYISCMSDAGWELPEPERAEHGALVLDGADEGIAKNQLSEFNADHLACIGASGLPRPGHGHEHSHHEHEHSDHEHEH